MARRTPSLSIVVGIDFLEGGRRAVQAVSFLARGQAARIALVHAFPPKAPNVGGAEGRNLRTAIAGAESDEALQLTAIAQRLRDQGFEVDTVAVKGKPAATLLAEACKRKAGLLAVGTSGRPAVAGLHVGSVAQALLRDSPVPVLVAPSRPRRGSKRAGPVLVGLDLGPASKDVLAAAAALARDIGVPLHAFHATPLPIVWTPAESGMMITAGLEVEDELEVARALTQAVEAARLAVKTTTGIGLGDAATHLLVQAQQLGAAAIVVGRRQSGRRLGSVSAAVAHASDRPVLVIPPGFGRAPRAPKTGSR